MSSDQLSLLARSLQDVAGGQAVRAGTRDDIIDGHVPGVVVTPEDLEALRKTVDTAAEQGVTVAPTGGRTRTELGNRPDSLDLAVDMTRLKKLVAHTPDDLTAVAEAGMTVGELQRLLAEQGQFVAVDPPLPERATIGGTLAVGLSGPLKWQYGNPRDVAIGMKVVQADGKLTKSGGEVVKNVSGYDLVRMHVGALGTLGVIAEVSLKLTPLPPGQATLIAAFDSLESAHRSGLALFHSNVVPLALTVYDRTAARLIDAPETGRDHYVAVRLAGRPRTLDRQVSDCAALLREPAVAVDRLESDAASDLWRRLADFGWDEPTSPAILGRALVRPTVLGGAEQAIVAVEAEGLRPAVVAHPAHGVMQVAWYAEADGPVGDTTLATIETARSAVHERGGRTVIERCPVEAKSEIDVWDDVGSAMATMRLLKEQFDPSRTFNPGRFVGGI